MRTYQEKTGYELSAREIFGRVRTGERAAKETVALFTHYLAEGLVSLVNVLRPEIIVIGGGVGGSVSGRAERDGKPGSLRGKSSSGND